MSGLNPSGLGINRSFGETDHDSLSTESVSTEDLRTEARGPRVTVHVKNGTIVANGPSSELASGDVTTPDDVRRVIQTAIDEGGSVSIKRHSSPYTMNVGGQDADGVNYCLSMSGATHLDIEEGATLEYSASNYLESDSGTPDVSTVLLASGVDNWKMTGGGTLDGGVHTSGGETQDQTDKTSAMCIRIGLKEANSGNDYSASACKQFEVHGLTLTGGYRHAIEVANESERWFVEGVTTDDGSGDDDFAAGGPAKHGEYRNCWSINKQREGSWTASAFEFDDGPEHVGFVNCWAINPGNGNYIGFQPGKTHGYADTDREYNENQYCVGCTAIGWRQGFYTFLAAGESDHTTIEGCYAKDCTIGYHLQVKSGATARHWRLEDCEARECSQQSVLVSGAGTFEDIQINDGSYVTSQSVTGNLNIIADGPVTDLSISGTTIDGGDPETIRTRLAAAVENLTIKDITNRNGSISLVLQSGGSLDQPKIEGIYSVRQSNKHINIAPTSGGVVTGLRIVNSTFKGSFAPIRPGGTNSDYTGGLVMDNDIYGTNTGFSFQNDSIRQEVRTLWNTGNDDDPSPEVPANPDSGLRYIDDGTNTTTETLRVYLGGGWRAMASA